MAAAEFNDGVAAAPSDESGDDPLRETFTVCRLALSPNARQTHTRGYARAVHGNQRHGAGKPFHLLAGNRAQRRLFGELGQRLDSRRAAYKSSVSRD